MKSKSHIDFNVKDFKLGDIITTYHKGYWKLIKIDRRFYTKEDIDRYTILREKGAKVGDEYNPIFHYEKVLTDDFEPVVNKKPIVKQCDGSYCQKVTKKLVEKWMRNYLENLQKLLLIIPQ